jgi:uncharacterized MAPEG superfamily protein
MTTELIILFYSVILFFTIIILQASLAIVTNGAMVQAGSRDDLPEPSVLRKRLMRLSANMQENLIMFAALVLIAHGIGVNNDATVLGSMIFLFMRIPHALVYIFGWPYVRPLFWVASVYGMGLIAFEIFAA